MDTIQDRLNASLTGRYRVERQLGSGGMATVYLAEDLKHNRRVALKVLHHELGAMVGAERFLGEIRTTANLQHPHILALYDSGEAEGLLFYVMPLVDGETLRERLRRERQLPVSEAVAIAKDVAGALGYAHRHGVIHRDVKPENIFLHDGKAVVADFGIALGAVSPDTTTRMTQAGLAVGTPLYMSPEQALGERSITASADLYALGCVLYEMLTGQPPFTGATAQAILAQKLGDQPSRPSRLRPSVPANVEDTVMAALAKLPADRIQNATSFIDGLLESSKIPVASAQPAQNAGSRQSPRQWQFISAALAVVAAAGWAVAIITERGPAYAGPKGCETHDGVWRHVESGVTGMWITHNGYALEVLYRDGAKTPETSAWRLIKCSDTSTTSVYLDSTLAGPDASALQTGAEVTGPVRVEQGIMVWQNPGKDGRLGSEHRGERIR